MARVKKTGILFLAAALAGGAALFILPLAREPATTLDADIGQMIMVGFRGTEAAAGCDVILAANNASWYDPLLAWKIRDALRAGVASGAIAPARIRALKIKYHYL